MEWHQLFNKARQRKRRSSLPQGTNPVWTRSSKPLPNKKIGASAPFFYTPLRKPFRILSKLPAQIKPPAPRKSAHTIYQRCVSSEKNASET